MSEFTRAGDRCGLKSQEKALCEDAEFDWQQEEGKTP